MLGAKALGRCHRTCPTQLVSCLAWEPHQHRMRATASCNPRARGRRHTPTACRTIICKVHVLLTMVSYTLTPCRLPSMGSQPSADLYGYGQGLPTAPNRARGASYPLAPTSTYTHRRSKPQCWDHGCNGREFSTFSNLLRHQREKEKKATKHYCPRCGAEFTRSTARTNHLLQDKCKSRPNSEGDQSQPF